MTRREHIEELAESLDAKIVYGQVGRYGAMVNIATRELFLPAPQDAPIEETYWVALHELGHLAIEAGEDPTPTNPTLDDLFEAMLTGVTPRGTHAAEAEARAWVWALDNSAFPLDQAGESSIAWGLADRLRRDWEPGPALERIYQELGDDPDWFFNVTEPAHWDKLEGYARPAWAKLAKHYGSDRDALPSTR